MFERFSDRARRSVVLAQEEARMLGHNYIGTEHMLLGLVHEDEGVAALVLKSLGLTLESTRDQVEKIIGTLPDTPAGHIPFTPRAKKVHELALREALQLGHNYIGTEHLLLALVREGEGVGAQVLLAHHVTLEDVRQAVIRALQGYKDDPAMADRVRQMRESAQKLAAKLEARTENDVVQQIADWLEKSAADTEYQRVFSAIAESIRNGDWRK